MIHSCVVHIICKLIIAVRKSLYAGPESPLRVVLELVHTVHQKHIIPVKCLCKAFRSYPVRCNLSLKIPVPLSWNPAVGHEKSYNIFIDLSVFTHAYQRNLKSLLENADRVSRSRSGYLASHIAVMGQISHPSNESFSHKNRLGYCNVGQMSSSAVVRVVSHEHIAWADIR